MKSLKLKLSIAAISLFVGSLLTTNAAVQLSDKAELFFTGKAAFEYEDNIFLTSTAEVDDIAFVLTPGFELVFNDDAVTSLLLSYNHEFKFYEDADNLDDDYAHLKFNAMYDSGVFVGTASASYDELSSNTVDINNAADLVSRDVSKVSFLGKYKISDLTAFSVGLNADATDFKPLAYRDSDTVGVPLTVYYSIRPEVDLTAGYRYRDVNVDGALDYEDQFFFIGAEGELFSPKVRANIQLGVQDRDAEAVGGDISSSTYNAKVLYLADASSTYFISLDRDFKTASLTGGTLVSTIASVGGKFKLTEAFAANGSISAGTSDYRGVAREEDLLFVTLGGTYSPNDYLKLSVNYQYQDVDGNGTAGSSTFTNNKLVFAASVRY